MSKKPSAKSQPQMRMLHYCRTAFGVRVWPEHWAQDEFEVLDSDSFDKLQVIICSLGIRLHEHEGD